MPPNSDLKQALWQIEALQATLNALKQKVASQMEPDRDDAGKLRCWACGGRMRRTIYRYHCRQDNGPCGHILVLRGREVVISGNEKTSFHPTEAHHNGKPAPVACYDHAFIHLFIVAGEVVTQ
jgi:hypothetical protein